MDWLQTTGGRLLAEKNSSAIYSSYFRYFKSISQVSQILVHFTGGFSDEILCCVNVVQSSYWEYIIIMNGNLRCLTSCQIQVNSIANHEKLRH